MDKSERVLGMGYLVKSPVDSKYKKILPTYWNKRWCVFSEITYSGFTGREKKLFLKYFENKKSYSQDEQPNGQLNISDCVSIQSHYSSVAGFDHVFVIECDDGNCVHFSPCSCDVKFKWIALLCKHKFKSDVMAYSPRQRTGSKNSWKMGGDLDKSGIFSSFEEDTSEKSESGFGYGHQDRLDSGTFSTSTVSSKGCDPDKAPPLPPRRNRSSSEDESLASLKDLAHKRDSGIVPGTFTFQDGAGKMDAPTSTRNEVEKRSDEAVAERAATMRLQLAYAGEESSLQQSLLCHRCQKKSKKGKGILRRFSSRKQLGEQHEMIEVERVEKTRCAFETNPLDQDTSSQELSSGDSISFNDEVASYSCQKGASLSCEDSNNYIEIDNRFLHDVELLSIGSPTLEKSGKVADNTKDQTDEDDNYDDDVYVPMNIFTNIKRSADSSMKKCQNVDEFTEESKQNEEGAKLSNITEDLNSKILQSKETEPIKGDCRLENKDFESSCCEGEAENLDESKQEVYFEMDI